MNQHEQMAQMFAALDAEGRRFIMVMLQGEYDEVQKLRRPALRLIKSNQRAAPSQVQTEQIIVGGTA
jgi:hypothetical protein